VTSPVFGPIIDKVGHRVSIFMAAPLLSIVSFSCFGFFPILPSWLLLALLGIALSVAASTLWSCIPLVCEPQKLGTAMGITACIQ
ncbi:major facilitator superfamily protein, partial [Kipferlia bialata]